MSDLLDFALKPEFFAGIATGAGLVIGILALMVWRDGCAYDAKANAESE